MSFIVSSWMIITLILIGFPVILLLSYLIKYGFKGYQKAYQKFEEVKALDTMRKELIEKNVQQVRTELHIDEDTPSLQHKEHKKISTPERLQDKQDKLLEKLKYEGLVQKERGNIEGYEKKLIEGLALDPENIDFLKMLSELYFNMSNHKKALSLLKKVLDKNPEDHKAIRQIGEIYLDKGQFDTAELLIEKAINLAPNNHKYYVSMVEVKYNLWHKEESINLMEKVIKLRPTNISYLQALAKLYEETWDHQNAKKYYFKILELEPTNDDAKNKLRALGS